MIERRTDIMNLVSSLIECKECVSKINFYNNSLNSDDLKVKEENGRNIYFSPIGNQFNFGLYNNGKTPKIVLMGITTSPTARDSFCKDYCKYYSKKQSADEAMKNSCVLNIFNSKPSTLLKRLSKILNLASLWKLIRINQNIELYKEKFDQYVNGNIDNDFDRVMDDVYFTQLIFCASCIGKNDSKAPKVKDIGTKHMECINAQIRFFESFKDRVLLLISFGIADTLPGFSKIQEKCEHYVKISHPASARGWNELDKMNLPDEEFRKQISDKTNKKGYHSQIVKCYNQRN